jgi:hypothetical protein
MPDPITYVAAPEQQHMLFMFLPIVKGTLKKGLASVAELSNASKTVAVGSGDLRASTGVHFSFFYGLSADEVPNPVLPVPSFQTAKGKDLLVVQALYDADFGPYISAFVNVPAIAEALNGILYIADESGIVEDTDPTSAVFMRNNGGVAANADSFNCFLMRYNFADPTIPASLKPVAGQKYILSGTLPGLTVGKILEKYPDAKTLWPSPAVDIAFGQSIPPICD